uniref:Reverse transcriptase domain-containing protein n=1 Tax=Tanacetum cinerariifolium TaxID=118510 RepID=A0A6L2JGG5_TANCI|nr:reverse transcriptase domain-containing protein [Tanacetum cinerariifolium]
MLGVRQEPRENTASAGTYAVDTTLYVDLAGGAKSRTDMVLGQKECIILQILEINKLQLQAIWRVKEKRLWGMGMMVSRVFRDDNLEVKEESIEVNVGIGALNTKVNDDDLGSKAKTRAKLQKDVLPLSLLKMSQGDPMELQLVSELVVEVEVLKVYDGEERGVWQRDRGGNTVSYFFASFKLLSDLINIQEVAIGGTLLAKGRTELCSILKKNLDIFAWQPSDMTGVPRSVVEHRLNIREGYSPVRQKKRGQAPERAKAIQAEVQKIVDAGIMREVYYHDWLSNPVMVKKHDGSWRMCVDFTDLNKACPQDYYPLPEIDWKVESLCGYPFKCFLDTYKGYHQIQLAELDEEKIVFHTGQGVYFYTKMPFSLKNVGATYQRLVDKAFNSQIGQNIEVYVDDLVVKSYTKAEMLRDIDETFRTLRKINMKLNPKKFTFGEAEGVLLGYVVTLEGIKLCPDKTAVVLQLPSPRTIKEVQSLNGKLASLNRFLSKSVEKSFLLFKTLKKCIKKSDFHWNAKAEQAFKQLKQHLSELPLLVAPRPKEELIIYLSATYGAISAVLMTERGATQMPIYFIIHKRLRRYLQAHPITVITDQPIKHIMSRLDMVGRLQKWSVKLGEHNITYRPRTPVKGQILADFLTEMLDENPPAALVAETQQESWTLFTDGSSCVDGSGAGLILINPEGIEFTYALRFQFAASNNEAEYEALIAGLRIAAQMGVQNIHVSVDSKLVANQVLGTYVAKEENMIKYRDKVKILVLVKILKEKSIKEKEVTTVVEEDGPTWMTPIVEYLKEGTLPSDKKEARKLRIKA